MKTQRIKLITMNVIKPKESTKMRVHFKDQTLVLHLHLPILGDILA